MNKLHTYMLPIAAGSFALMLSPLAEITTVAYSLIFIIIITGIIGLQTLAKNNEAVNKKNEKIVQNLEQLQSQIENLVQDSSKQIQLTEQQTAEQLIFAKDIKQHYKTLVEATTEQTASMIEQTKQQTLTLNDSLHKIHASIDMLQKAMINHLAVTADKIDEGNTIIENVSILMVKELQTINHNMDGLVSLQSMLPNELNYLQDVISRNQEQLIDGTRELESQLESLKDIATTHSEQVATSHQELIYKVSEEFTSLSKALQQETMSLIKQANNTTKIVETHLIKTIESIQNIDIIGEELQKINVTNNDKVDQQLVQLIDISSALLQGIAQLTNSQSAERKQLLAIQKKLISKYSKS